MQTRTIAWTALLWLAAGCADDEVTAPLDRGARLDATDPPDATADAAADATADAASDASVDAASDATSDAITDATLDALPDAIANGMPDATPDPTDADPVPDATPDPTPDAAPPEGPAVYAPGRDHSPITPHVAANLRAIAARAPAQQDDVFSKIGASSTVSPWFMHCFAGDAIDLDGRDHLWPTIDHFAAGDAAGTDPYTRESLSATVGWSARNALAGDPSPLQQEIDATRPRHAIVMYGTNDIQRRDIDGYAGDLFTLVDTLTAQGIIPILSAIMPRDDDPEADALVPSYNAVVRGVAQARQIPFIDYHRRLAVLPDHGLGQDRLHASVYRTPQGARPCDFTPDGLTAGYNIRNLLVIEALTRVRAALADQPAQDPPAPLATAAGTLADPIEVTALPYTDTRDTTASPHRRIDAYPACGAAQDESGPEYVYRLTLDRPTLIRAWVLDRGLVDIDLHLLGGPDPATCLDRDHRELVASLDPGEWYLVADTFVAAAGERAGEYLLVIVEE
ncbi:MAG: SGNH/GDSL hydrolase family protein [bacterium]